MNLYNKYRPSEFEHFVGNENVVKMLRGFFDPIKENHPHSFLFSGSSGTGKTTMARIIASKLAHESAIFEYNSADDRGIDTIRELYDLIRDKPILSKNIIIILDEFHMGTVAGQNALLKLLEDFPDYVYIIICTTDPNKLIPTIQNRCTHVSFKPLTGDQLYSLLRKIRISEKMDISPDILTKIVECSEGIPRKALVLLEGVNQLNDEDKQIEFIKNSSTVSESHTVLDLCRCVHAGRPWKEQSTYLDALLKEKEDPERIRRAIMGYLCRTILHTIDDISAHKLNCFIPNLYDSGFPGLILQCYKASSIGRGKEKRLEDFI